MLTLNVPQTVRQTRLQHCFNCKYYVASTKSCGTVILGGTIDDADIPDANVVTYYRKKVRLCGCRMHEKTRYAFATCPIGKWQSYKLSTKQTIELAKFLKSIPDKGILELETVNKIYAYFETMAGRRISRCDKCVPDMLRELRKQIGESTDL